MDKKEYISRLAKFLVANETTMTGENLAEHLNWNKFKTSYGTEYTGEMETYTLIDSAYDWLVSINQQGDADKVALAFKKPDGSEEIKNLIEKYAKVYKDFEKLQTGINSILTNGDQKTGVIGEYYAKCYIESLGVKEVEYAKPGESFDLKYHSDEGTIKVQVKAVSAHSKTRIIAPLNLTKSSFDFLYLISLDKNFIPNGFYINTYAYLKDKADGKDRIQGSIMKGTSVKDIVKVEKKGSSIYDFTTNEIKTLLDAIK